MSEWNIPQRSNKRREQTCTCVSTPMISASCRARSLGLCDETPVAATAHRLHQVRQGTPALGAYTPTRMSLHQLSNLCADHYIDSVAYPCCRYVYMRIAANSRQPATNELPGCIYLTPGFSDVLYALSESRGKWPIGVFALRCCSVFPRFIMIIHCV